MNELSPIEPETVEIEQADSRRVDFVNGQFIDPATGRALARLNHGNQIEILCDDGAEWALELRSKTEGEIAGIDSRIEALTSNLKAIRSVFVRRLSSWEYRFAPSLALLAREKLRGRKERTAQFGWGRVSFRASKGTNEIVDMGAAVAWMRSIDPDRINVKESVNVEDVLAVLEELTEATGEEPEHLPWMRSTGPGENVTIETGIAVKLSKKEKRSAIE